MSKHTIYARKSKYGGMDVNEAQEQKPLRDENARLRKLIAESESGQRRVAVGDEKKQLELVALKAASGRRKASFFELLGGAAL